MERIIICHIYIFKYTALGRKNIEQIIKVEEKLSQQELWYNNSPEEAMNTKLLEY